MVSLPWRDGDANTGERERRGDAATPPARDGTIEFIPADKLGDDLDHFVDFDGGGLIRAEGVDLGRWR